jgi:hypothetical protein
MSDPEVKKEKKEKRVMTPEKLEQLARARRKALEIRQAGASLKQEQKELAEAALEEKLENERQVKEAVKKSLSVAKKEPTFHPTPPKEIENKIIKAELVDNPVTQEYVPEYSPRIEVQAPMLSRQPIINDEFDDEEEPEPEPAPAPVKHERVRDASRVKSKKPIKTKIVIEQSSDDEDEFHPHEHVIFVKRKSKNDSKAKVVPASTPAPPTSPVRGQRENIVLQREQRQLPTFPLDNNMNDFVNAGFTNYRKYY